MYIYVGDSADVIRRILTCHCSGNVEGSALRKHIATVMGFPFSRSRRPRGTQKLRLDLPDPRSGEMQISSYLRSGGWKYVVCTSYEEANAFQWFAIEALDPLLNKDRRGSNPLLAERFRSLLTQLERSGPYLHARLRSLPSGPGVYALCHDSTPSAA